MVILKIKTHYLGYFLDDSKLLCKRLLNQNMIKSCKSLVHNYICTFFIFIKGIIKIITQHVIKIVARSLSIYNSIQEF